MPAVLTLVMVTSAEMMVIVAWSETSELYYVDTDQGWSRFRYIPDL